MTEFAREYGDGLYALAEEEKLEESILGEMQILKDAFAGNYDFVRLLDNQSLTKEERTGILEASFRDKVHPYLLNFMKILCEHGSMREFAGCEEAYRLRYNKEHGVVEAMITTASPITEEQRKALSEKLRVMTNAQVHITEKIDASLIGGLVLEMNGKRWDDTVAGRLETMKQIISGKA